MAGAIKGITVEIGGDTTKLGKALSDVNNKSRDLQKELKGVNTLLKMDPGNTELLRQKHELLTKAVANTKDKLDTLKEAQAQVQEQFDKGKITEEQYRDFQREIVATEQKLKSLTDQAKEFGSVGAQKIAEVGKKVQETGGKIENAGKKMSVVSAGIVALGTASIAAFNELDEGYDTIIEKTGATGEALDSLYKSADNVFTSMPVEMGDVGVAIGEINTRFGLMGGELEDLSVKFLQFAKINGVDLNNSIGLVARMLEQFNMDGSEAGNVMDLITLKGQETGVSVDTLMKSIQTNGSTIKDMGLNLNEAVVLLAQFEANGVNAEVALKAMKKASQSYTKEGISMSEGLSKTIDAIKNAETDTEALAIAQETFGAKGASEMAKAIREERLDINDLSASLDDYSGVVTNTFNATLDPVDEAKVGMNNLKVVGAELGEAIQVALLPIINGLSSGLKSLCDWFTNLSPAVKTTIVIVAGLVASIGPVLLIIGKLVTSVGTIMTMAPKIMTAVKGVGLAIKGLGASMAANPIGLIAVAITALVAAFIYLWNNCEGFRKFWIGLWENIKAAFQSFLTWIAPAIEKIKSFFVSLWAKIQEIWNAIIASLQPVFESISGAFQEAWALIRVVWDAVAPYFLAIWQQIEAVFSVVKEVLGMHFKNAWEAIKLVWSVAVSYFQTIWNNIVLVFSVVKTYFAGMFKTAWEAIKAVWNAVTGYFKAIWDTIAGIFSVVRNVLTGNWRDAWNGIKGIVGTWVSYFKGVWDSIKNVFGSVKSWFSSTFLAAWSAVKGVFSNWGSFFAGLWNSIKNTFSNIGTNIATAISGAVKAGINGVISRIEGVINTGVNLINGAINLINKIPGVSIGKLGRLSLPRLARGGIVDRPTLAEVGEDGREAIIPLDRNTGWIRQVAQDLNRELLANTSNAELLHKLDDIYSRLDRLQIVLDTGALVGETIDMIDAGLANRQLLTARGV